MHVQEEREVSNLGGTDFMKLVKLLNLSEHTSLITICNCFCFRMVDGKEKKNKKKGLF